MLELLNLGMITFYLNDIFFQFGMTSACQPPWQSFRKVNLLQFLPYTPSQNILFSYDMRNLETTFQWTCNINMFLWKQMFSFEKHYAWYLGLMLMILKFCTILLLSLIYLFTYQFIFHILSVYLFNNLSSILLVYLSSLYVSACLQFF